MKHFQKVILLSGMILLVLGIILGAFGTHGLKGKISTEQIASFETGVKYQIYHGLALLALGATFPYLDFSLKWSFRFMILGLIFFSGSIYFLSLQEICHISISKIIGPITPIGGLLLIISWMILIIGLVKQKVTKS